MTIGIFSEGTIDLELTSAILERLARTRCGVRWPLQLRDSFATLPIRKGGHGQIARAVKRVISMLEDEPYVNFSFFVIVLDKKTQHTQREIKRAIRGLSKFIVGIAIREIEAWWLADRRNTLEWLGLIDHETDEGKYWQKDYNPERDNNPKQTLNELTEISPLVDSRYGNGNTDLAREFASIWRHGAEIDQIEIHCPKGFAPFSKKICQRILRIGRDR